MASPTARQHAAPLRQFLLAMLLGSLALLWAQPALSAEPGSIVIGDDSSAGGDKVYSHRLFKLISTEAFKRIKVPLEIVHYPNSRMVLMLEQGKIDGVMARAKHFGEVQRNVV